MYDKTTRKKKLLKDLKEINFLRRITRLERSLKRKKVNFMQQIIEGDSRI